MELPEILPEKCRDRKDDYLLELAVISNADFLITGDKDLLVYCVTNDMTGYCVTPNDFILHETQPYIEQGKDVFDRRHYHETNSLGYLTNETIAENVADIMKRVK